MNLTIFLPNYCNDDISRLKYEGEGRGNGTMHFINKFIYLGRYGIENTDFNPILNVISGHTVLTCDGKYQPSDEVTNKMIHYCPRKSVNIFSKCHIFNSLTTV